MYKDSSINTCIITYSNNSRNTKANQRIHPTDTHRNREKINIQTSSYIQKDRNKQIHIDYRTQTQKHAEATESYKVY